MHDAYKKVYGTDVTKENIREIVAKDPGIWCRHFQIRIQAFLDFIRPRSMLFNLCRINIF